MTLFTHLPHAFLAIRFKWLCDCEWTAIDRATSADATVYQCSLINVNDNNTMWVQWNVHRVIRRGKFSSKISANAACDSHNKINSQQSFDINWCVFWESLFLFDAFFLSNQQFTSEANSPSFNNDKNQLRIFSEHCPNPHQPFTGKTIARTYL